MRTVISFNEGCSGNFLAALVSNSTINEYVRIDTNDNLLKYSIVPQLTHIPGRLLDIVVTHSHDYDKIVDKLAADRVIRIETITGIYNAIYNVFIKKHIAEDRSPILTIWPDRPAYCYDMTFEHLKDYHAKFSKIKYHTSEILFDFGWTLDVDSIVDFLVSLGIQPNVDLIKKYITHQQSILLNHTLSTMTDIVDQIPDDNFTASPWWACYCIFQFEKNNNLPESSRKWTIDSLPILNKSNLINLSKLYD
jgi:hypothetical protein